MDEEIAQLLDEKIREISQELAEYQEKVTMEQLTVILKEMMLSGDFWREVYQGTQTQNMHYMPYRGAEELKRAIDGFRASALLIKTEDGYKTNEGLLVHEGDQLEISQKGILRYVG